MLLETYVDKTSRKRAYMKAYRAEKADEIKARKKSYNAEKALEIKARNKAYRAKKVQEIKARKKAYSAKKAQEIKAYKKAYHAKKADEIKARSKAYHAKKADESRARSKAYYAKKAHEIKAQKKVYRQQKLGCVTCKSWPDWRIGLSHYDGMCYRCFCEKFPTHEKVRTKARVELQVRAFIDRHFQDFVHDEPMKTAHCDCNHRRRVDHRRVVGDTLLCIETDEWWHRGYDPEDEQARYHDVLLAWGGKLCFVRINPDGRGPVIEERLERLRAEITRHIGRLERGENTSYLEVYHLYYPEGTPDCV